MRLECLFVINKIVCQSVCKPRLFQAISEMVGSISTGLSLMASWHRRAYYRRKHKKSRATISRQNDSYWFKSCNIPTTTHVLITFKSYTFCSFENTNKRILINVQIWLYIGLHFPWESCNVIKTTIAGHQRAETNWFNSSRASQRLCLITQARVTTRCEKLCIHKR